MADDTFEHHFRWVSSDPSSVIVTGNFDGWQRSLRLKRLVNAGRTRLPYGQKVLYKYIVDSHWKVNQMEPTEKDVTGNINNVLAEFQPTARPQLENDIRCLTQFLSQYYPQITGNLPLQRNRSKTDPYYEALSSIATLLSFQVDYHVICVIGDFHNVTSLNFLYQASSSVSGESESIPVSEPPAQLGKPSGSVDMLFTGNGRLPVAVLRGQLELVEILPSSKTLEGLSQCAVPPKRVDKRYSPIEQQLSLIEHARDMVTALQSYRTASDQSKACSQLQIFFLRRCWNKLRLRLKTDTKILKEKGEDKKEGKFADIIREWHRGNATFQVEKIKRVQGPPPPTLRRLLDLAGVISNGTTWELNKQNVKGWATCLVFQLARITETTGPNTPPNDEESYSLVLAYLQGLTWMESKGLLTALVEEPSLLASAYRQPVPLSSDESKDLEDVALDKEVINIRSDDPADAFLRFIKGITACNRAVSLLANSPWVQVLEISFNLHNLIAPTADSRGMTDLKQILNEIDDWDEGEYENLVKGINIDLFKGTVHSEALSVGRPFHFQR